MTDPEFNLERDQAYKIGYPKTSEDPDYAMMLDNGRWLMMSHTDVTKRKEFPYPVTQDEIESILEKDHFDVEKVHIEETDFRRATLGRTNPTQCPACESVGTDWNNEEETFECPSERCGVDRFHRGLLEGRQPLTDNYRRGQDGRGI